MNRSMFGSSAQSTEIEAMSYSIGGVGNSASMPAINNFGPQQTAAPVGVDVASSQLAYMSLAGNDQYQIPQHFSQSVQDFGVNGQVPFTGNNSHAVPTSLDLGSGIIPRSMNLYSSQNNVGAIQSPLSPLNSSVFYGYNFPYSQMGQGVPSDSPNSSNTSTTPQTQQNYTPQNQTTTQYYQNINPYTNNNMINNNAAIDNQQTSHLSPQQMQILQQQIYQHQQLTNQGYPDPNLHNQQTHHQHGGVIYHTSPQGHVVNKFAERDGRSHYVAPEPRPNLGTLPHSLPTTLNPSLVKKTSRGVLNSSGESMSPMSPRAGQLQDSWDIYDEANASGPGSSVSSPVSTGTNFVVTPRYDTPSRRDHCLRCNQKVYPMEKIGPGRDVLYHKNCFRCAVCNTQLSLKNFHHNPNDNNDYNVFCTSHKPRITNLSCETTAMYMAGSASAASSRKGSVAEQYQSHQDVIRADTTAIPEYAMNQTQEEPAPNGSAAQTEHAPLPVETENVAPESTLRTTNGATTNDTKDTETRRQTNPVEVQTSPNPKTDDRADTKVSTPHQTKETNDVNVSISQKTSNKDAPDAKLTVSQNTQTATPLADRKSLRSINSGSSPFSSISSTSSLATSLKTDTVDTDSNSKGIIEEPDFFVETRSDRPSSRASSTSSSAGVVRMRADRQNSTEKENSNSDRNSLASNSSFDRPDRPSVFQRSNSNTEQPSVDRFNVEMRNHNKRPLVKSQSNLEFSSGSDPQRLLTRNESMRLDRPSQYL